MTAKTGRLPALKSLAAVLYFLLLAFPFLGFLQGGDVWEGAFAGARRLRLAGNTFLLAFLSAAGCVAVGLLAAAFLHNGPLRRKKARWFFLLLAPVPYYVYALAWMYFVRLLGVFDRSLMRGLSSGLAPCLFVDVLAFLPVSTGLILAAMERHDWKAEEMGLIYAAGNRVFFRIAAPGALPAAVAAFAFVFVLSATDFSVPSLFQHPTYALEVFAEYGRTGSLKQAGAMAVPLVFAAMILLAIADRGVQAVPLQKPAGDGQGLPLSGAWKMAGRAAVFLCFLQIAVPTALFFMQSGSFRQLLESLALCKKELFISIAVAVLAAMTAVPLAGPAAVWLGGKARWLKVLAMLPMAMPSSLIGMGLLEAVNGSPLHALSQTLYFPALGCAVKYMPFALLVFDAAHKRAHREEFEAGRVFMPSEWRYFWNIVLPGYWQGIVCAAALVFLFTMGEEGMPLALMPPGYETLAVKIYQYLHYGASELVSGFCLATILFTAGLFAAVLNVGKSGRRMTDKGDDA